jgi:hypothetical protein
MNTEQQLIEKWCNLSLDKQQQVLQFIEFLEFQTRSQSKLKTGLSALETAGNVVGSLEAPKDLSTNKDYLKGFGQ